MRKVVALVLSLLLCGVFFMPTVTYAEEKTKIVMWDFWTEGIGAGFYNFWNEKIAQYNEMHPNVEIERVLVPQDEYLGSKLTTAFATDSGPDIFFASAAIMKPFLDADVAAPLNQYFSEEVLADIIPSSLELCTRDGIIYGVPWQSDLVALYYDKDILEEAGVEPPKTWNELKEVAEKVNTDLVSGFTFDITAGDWQLFTFYPFVWQGGGDLFDENGYPQLDSEPVVNALTLWHDLLASGASNESLSRICGEIGIIGDGETAMQINGSWSVPTLETVYADRNIGVVPLPIPDVGGKAATVAGGWRMMINKKCENIDAAADFIKWLWLDDDVSSIVKWCTEATFAYPVRLSAIEQAKDFYSVNLRAVFTEQINETSKPELALDGTMNEIVSDMIQDALYNMTPTEAAKKAQERAVTAYNGQ